MGNTLTLEKQIKAARVGELVLPTCNSLIVQVGAVSLENICPVLTKWTQQVVFIFICAYTYYIHKYNTDINMYVIITIK